MKIVNNQEFKKTSKKKFFSLILSIFFIMISGLSFGGKYVYEKNEKKKSIYLNNIIINYNNENNVNTHLDVYAIEILVAKSNTRKDLNIYIVSDDNYYYLAALDTKTYNKIKNSDLNKKPYRLYGKTAVTDSQIKQIIINAYNTNIENEDDKINEAEFDKLYGGVYIDATKANEASIYFIITSIVSASLGVLLLIVFVINKILNKKAFKKLSEEDLKQIEKEINEENTIKYPETNLILTKSYIINTTRKLLILKYRDIIWIYEYEIKQKGKSTSINIVAKTNIGKSYYIAQFKNTKKNTTFIKEIITKITSANKKILIGFNSENEIKANELIQKYKKTKK